MRLELDNIILAILALFAAYWHIRIWWEFRRGMRSTRRLIKLFVVGALLFITGAEISFIVGVPLAWVDPLFGTSHGVLIAALMGLGMSDYAERRANANRH